MKDGASKKLVWLCLAIALTWALASGVSAQPGEFVNGKLQPLADGFPGRALTLVVCDEAGTSDGIYARSLQEALRPILTVPVMVSDEPMAVGGTFHKIKDIQSRAGGKDGYYSVVMPVWGPSTDILVDSAIEKELGMNLDDLNMVIVTDNLARAFIQRKNPPWGPTFAGMVKWGKANPGKLRYISLEVGSGFDILCTWVMQQTGITAEKIPQGTHVQVIATLGSGEGDFGMTNADPLVSNSKKIVNRLYLGPTAQGERI